MEMLLIMVVFIGLMYVLMVLPQKRRMEQQKKMLSGLEPGARVLLNTGMFGTIRAQGETQMVIELAPGVEVTMLRQAIVRQATAEEEEFEYSDGGAPAIVDDFSADDAQLANADTYAQPESGEAAEIVVEQPDAATETQTVGEQAEGNQTETNFYGQVVEEDDSDRQAR